MSDRTLTTAQRVRLDKLADEEEGTAVVGWYDDGTASPNRGPIIRRQRNGAPRFDYAAYRFIDLYGHIMPVPKAALSEAGLL